MALIDDFKAQFPEFDPTAVDDAWTGLESLYPCLYGGEYGSSDCVDQAILYLIAHLFYIDSNDPAATAVIVFPNSRRLI